MKSTLLLFWFKFNFFPSLLPLSDFSSCLDLFLIQHDKSRAKTSLTLSPLYRKQQ